jgi:hypothetical protein
MTVPLPEPFGAALVNTADEEAVAFYSPDMFPDESELKERFSLVRVYSAAQMHEYAAAVSDALRNALKTAEAALADIGDADREPGDDLAWCERRAAQALPAVRAALEQP